MTALPDEFDLARLRQDTWLADVVYHDELASTNSEALRLAASVAELPLLVLARRQLAGRGRGEHRWWADSGALTFSLLLDQQQVGMPAERWPLVSLLTGLAVARALEGWLDGTPIGLKWPNDVFLGGRKLGGILIEAASARRPRLVVGIGVNVNNSLREAPPEVIARGTSLFDTTDARRPLTDVLLAILAELRTQYGQFLADPVTTLAAWRSRCVLTGRQVEIATGSRVVSGRCAGIGDDGALWIEQPDGRVRVVSGEVRRAEGLLEPGA